MRVQYFHQTAQETSDIYADTHTHVIKKKLAEGQLSKQLGKHEIIILSPNGKGSPRHVHRLTHTTKGASDRYTDTQRM